MIDNMFDNVMNQIYERCDSISNDVGVAIVEGIQRDMLLYHINNGGTNLAPYVDVEMLKVVKNDQGKYTFEFDMGNHSDFFKECFQFYLDSEAQKAVKMVTSNANGG